MLEIRQNGNQTLYQIILDSEPQEVKKTRGKKKGQKSEVYPFEIEDMKKLIQYFKENEYWTQYLLFVLSCNMARRCGDMLNLKWKNFFNPGSGNIRLEILEIQEEKTDKLANPRINKACRNAIEMYIEKVGVDPSENNYENYVFLQMSGTHKGKVISHDGYLKSLKKAGAAVGIEYNIGTHSPRKTFGALSRMIHPNDYDSMELLQTIFNHSDTKTTKHYIGLTKKKVDQYYDDMGDFFTDYVIEGKEYQQIASNPVVTLDTNDLRNLLQEAYMLGINNKDADTEAHMSALNELLSKVESLQK